MKKNLTLILIFVQLNLFFAQEKIPLDFPNDSIFEVNDSVNKLPFLQIRYFPISSLYGRLYGTRTNSANGLRGSKYDCELNLRFKKIGLDFKANKWNVIRSGSPEKTLLNSYDYYEYINLYKDNQLRLTFRFKTIESFYDPLMKMKTNKNNDSILPINISKRFISKTFHNFNILIGFSDKYVSSNVGVEIGRNFTYTSNDPLNLGSGFLDTITNDHYRLDFFNGSNQKLINFGFKYNRLKKVKISTDNLTSFQFSNLNAYIFMNYLYDYTIDIISFSDVINNPENEYFNKRPTKANKISYSSLDNPKSFGVRKIRLHFGFDYQFSQRNSIFSWTTGYEFGWNPRIKWHSDSSKGIKGNYIKSMYQNLKFGVVFHLKNWKK